ncbi:MAG: hypothetical protein LR000_02055, partial [Candidatus Pacebacteria bacterium]|nr:hypothetical protein [Candidatus Paceibacterota bacterium]
MKKFFLILFIIILSSITLPVFAQTVNCFPPPSQVPLLGTFPINCVVTAREGVIWPFVWCP